MTPAKTLRSIKYTSVGDAQAKNKVWTHFRNEGIYTSIYKEFLSRWIDFILD